jgi:pyruvate,water dikinase
VLRLSDRYLPLREVGKAAFLMALDVARFAARRHGAELVAKGVLAEPDDVFAFTVPEIVRGLDGARGDVREVASTTAVQTGGVPKAELPGPLGGHAPAAHW